MLCLGALVVILSGGAYGDGQLSPIGTNTIHYCVVQLHVESCANALCYTSHTRMLWLNCQLQPSLFVALHSILYERYYRSDVALRLDRYSGRLEIAFFGLTLPSACVRGRATQVTAIWSGL